MMNYPSFGSEIKMHSLIFEICRKKYIFQKNYKMVILKAKTITAFLKITHIENYQKILKIATYKFESYKKK